MVNPTGSRGGGRRDGFGAGRHGRGAGRTGGRLFVWQRSSGGRGRGSGDLSGEGRSVHERSNQEEWSRDGGEEGDIQQEADPVQMGASSSTWDKAAEGGWKEKKDEDQARDQWKDHGHQPKQQQKEPATEIQDSHPSQPRQGCDYCGLKNHQIEECKKNACEICGMSNHKAFDCRREPSWSMGPELYAAQVHNQSFFYIDEHIDQRVIRHRASLAIITVIRGVLTAKELEMEFRSILNPDTWRWNARQVADNKYVMRFPNAKIWG